MSSVFAWTNFAVLLLTIDLTHWFYLRSVRPARRSQCVGDVAYDLCARDRRIAGWLMVVHVFASIEYRINPAPLGLADSFPWPWWISGGIAALIAIPSGYLLWRGVRDAGEEAMRPRPEHELYGGIYARIRHPQALGELPLFWAIALALHSPSLVLVSLLWLPVYIWWCIAEEQDLLLRYGESYAAYRARTGMFIPRRVAAAGA